MCVRGSSPCGSFVVLLKFDLLRPIRVLDLNALSDVYSDLNHFDPDYTEKRGRARFLKELVGEMSSLSCHMRRLKNISQPDCVRVFGQPVKPRLHGIIFSSARPEGADTT